MGVTYPEIIKLLKEEFEVKKTSKYSFCKATGINPTSVERYLYGISEPNQASLQKLADYFGVTVAYLRGEDVVPKALLADGADIFNRVLWPESTNIYLKHLWLLAHEFLLVLDDSEGYGNNPLLIRPTYLKALNVLEWNDDFYSNLDKSSGVYIKLKEHVESVFDSIKSGFNISFTENPDMKYYFQVFAQGVIDKYLAMLETIELEVIRGFSVLYKGSFTREETEIFKRRSQEEKMSKHGRDKKIA